jgi:hypothetical protein
MTQRPPLDAASASSPTSGRDTGMAVLDLPEPLPQRQLGGYYDPDSCSFEPTGDASADDASGWVTLALNLEPEGTVPANPR